MITGFSVNLKIIKQSNLSSYANIKFKIAELRVIPSDDNEKIDKKKVGTHYRFTSVEELIILQWIEAMNSHITKFIQMNALNLGSYGAIKLEQNKKFKVFWKIAQTGSDNSSRKYKRTTTRGFHRQNLWIET